MFGFGRRDFAEYRSKVMLRLFTSNEWRKAFEGSHYPADPIIYQLIFGDRNDKFIEVMFRDKTPIERTALLLLCASACVDFEKDSEDEFARKMVALPDDLNRQFKWATGEQLRFLAPIREVG